MSRTALRLAAASLAGAAVLVTAGTGGMAATAGTGSHAQGADFTVHAEGANLTAYAAGGAHLPFRDGPPARVTGGFGEDSCFACHWDGTENDEVGTLTIAGFPEHFQASVTYDLEITLTHPELEVAGFQLAIRRAEDGVQAGHLEVAEGEEERVRILTDREIDFAHHLVPGIEPTGEQATRWRLRWVAPEAPEGNVLLHASVVAGDGDHSQMGDAVYTIELESRPR